MLGLSNCSCQILKTSLTSLDEEVMQRPRGSSVFSHPVFVDVLMNSHLIFLFSTYQLVKGEKLAFVVHQIFDIPMINKAL